MKDKDKNACGCEMPLSLRQMARKVRETIDASILWVPVEEGLPDAYSGPDDEHLKCLVTIKSYPNGDLYVPPEMAVWDGEDWLWYDEGPLHMFVVEVEVVAWQYAPLPYDVRNNDNNEEKEYV